MLTNIELTLRTTRTRLTREDFTARIRIRFLDRTLERGAHRIGRFEDPGLTKCRRLAAGFSDRFKVVSVISVNPR